MDHVPSDIDRRSFLLGLGALLAAGCGSTPPPLETPPGGDAKAMSGELVAAAPESAGMSSARIEEVFARLERRVKDGLFPGFAALVARHGKIVGERAHGSMVRGANEAVTIDTIFDLESMTKVVATAIAAMVLVDRGELALDAPAVKFLPTFKGAGKEHVTVRDMLRYSSGLPLDNQFFGEPAPEIWRKMAETPLSGTPGQRVEYSDLTYRLLGKVIESAAGAPLDVFAREAVWKPLGMVDTMFTPPATLRGRIAATGPTERRNEMIRGVVQDDQDFELGGVCGCDGVFSTVKDVAIFCQMMLAGGTYAGTRILAPELAAAMVSNQTPFVDPEKTDTSPVDNLVMTPKGYGWELFTPRFSNGGKRLSPGSYGKAGGAGTFMWLDPKRDMFAILLTNRGLPVPFDDAGWAKLLEDTGSAEFYDGVVGAVSDAG